jgi:hypothetical protein
MTDYPEELDTDDIDELAAYIERRYPAEEVRMHDTEMIHFAYWDVSPHSVSTVFLEHIQRAGYRVLHAGIAKPPSRGRKCAWAECRKQADDTDDGKRGRFTIPCRHCDTEYTSNEAQSIVISGPDVAYYTCPRCGRGTDGPPPIPNNKS